MATPTGNLPEERVPLDRMAVGKFVQIKGENVEPFPRSGHCCETDGINMYVFGGFHPEYRDPDEPDEIIYNEIFREMWSFNLSTETWHKVQAEGDAPYETASMSRTSYPWGVNSNADVVAFNLKDKKWSILECTGDKRPPGKYGQAMVLHDDRLYFHGGCQRIRMRDDLRAEFLFDSNIYCLDASSHIWSQLFDLSTGEDQDDDLGVYKHVARGMYRHGLAWYDNKLYVIGSSQLELSTGDLDKINVFDLNEETWTIEMTTPCADGKYPPRRKHHSCVQWNNEVYICGGHNDTDIFDDIWSLEMHTLQWKKIQTSLPIPTCFHTATITPTKCMYVFGGVTSLGDPARLRPRTNNTFRIWLAIPPLVDIALRKVVSIVPTSAEILKLGIPDNLLDKLNYEK